MRLRKRLAELEERVAELEAREPVKWKPTPEIDHSGDEVDVQALWREVSSEYAAAWDDGWDDVGWNGRGYL